MRKLGNRIVFFLNILVALFLLLSYLAPLINPSKLLFPALLGLAYPYLLILNLLFVTYWIIYLKKEIFLSLIIILLGWNHLNNLLPFNIKQTQLPENPNQEYLFKALSYNVRGFDRFSQNEDPGSRENIFQFLREEDPDLLCIQEFYTSTRRGQRQRDIVSQLSLLPEKAIYYTDNLQQDHGFGIATFSKFPIIRKSRIPFSSSYNAAIYTDLLIQSDTIRLLNIHLQSIRFQKENYAFMDTARIAYNNQQMREIRAIRSRLKDAYTKRAEQAQVIANYIRDSPHPVLLMGDFNDTPHSYAYRKIKKGLKDAFRESGRGFGHTYTGELPSFRIDYILYDKHFKSFQFKRTRLNCSDHFPISAYLLLVP